MNITVVKQENCEEQVVKVEDNVEQEEVTTVVLQNIDEVAVSDEGIPYLLKDYAGNSDGNLEISQVEDGTYTYVIENSHDFEEGTEFELADGEHYIIEEYNGDYEDSQPDEYETLYIEQYEDEQPNDGPVYTITEEIEQPEDDEQMSIVEEETFQENFVQDKKPPKEVIKEEKLKQVTEQDKSPIKPIKIEADDEQQDQPEYVEPENIKNSDYVQKQPLEEDGDRFADVSQESGERTEDQVEKEAELGDKKSKEDEFCIFQCSICMKGFKTPTGVKRHITVTHWKPDEKQTKENNDVLAFYLCQCCGEPSDSAHTLGDFKCDQCDKLFQQQNSLDRHVSIDHPVGENFTCVDCKKMFKNRDLLVDHMRIHPIKSIKCEGCGREFTRKYHLERHIGQTGCMGVPKAVYDCRVCGRTFTRKDNLAEHLKVHAGLVKHKKKFVCEFCDKDFSGMALLNIHVRTHTGERPYGCDICEKRFPSSGAMKKHRRMHTGEKPYTCPTCGNKFAAKETLNRHWRTHTGEKPHQCSFCGKSFIQASQLRAHVFHHTGENAYTCCHCGRAFNRKLRLTTHIKFMHEGAAPLRCPDADCDKTFFRKEDIQRHMMTHTGERPYQCEICTKQFGVKSSLKIHQMIHRKENPVVCEVCNRAFIRQDCLMRHMRAKHRDLLEDILANAEKRRLQEQLFESVAHEGSKSRLTKSIIWNELTLTESIKELLTLLVDEDCLSEFGHPETPVDKVLDSVIRRCGHKPASEEDFDYIGKMRENAKLLFTVVIDDDAVKELLNNQTVDEVIMHVLKLARKTGEEEEEEEEDAKAGVTVRHTLASMEDEVENIEYEQDVDNPEPQDDADDDAEIIHVRVDDCGDNVETMEETVENCDSADDDVVYCESSSVKESVDNNSESVMDVVDMEVDTEIIPADTLTV